MNLLSESQLNGKNKTQLVELTLDLQSRLEAVSAGPLTSSEVERRVLDLQKQTISVKEKQEDSQRVYDEKIAKLKSDHELEIKRLELDNQSNTGLDAKALLEAYKDLEDSSKKAMDDLTFGLREAEIEAKGKLDKINERVLKVEEESEAKIAELNNAVKEASDKSSSSISDIKTKHDREMEQLKYDNAIALREESLEEVDKIAKKHKHRIIHEDQLAEYAGMKELDDTRVNAIVEAAVKTKSSEIYASEGTKYSKLKNESEQEIALLKKDKEYLQKTTESQDKRIADLESQVKDFPSQIANAVEAAKSSISVNQDAGGKK